MHRLLSFRPITKHQPHIFHIPTSIWTTKKHHCHHDHVVEQRLLDSRKTKAFKVAKLKILKATSSRPAPAAIPATHQARYSTMSSDTTSASSAPFFVRFYGQGAKDFRGRTLTDMLAWNNSTLERTHNYIQILFPLPEGSPYNSEAPILTKNTRDAFLESSELRKQLFKAFQRMAGFYGFNVDDKGDGKYHFSLKDSYYELARDTWLTSRDHNHLRISRIIRSLRILGLEPLAQAFRTALIQAQTKGEVSKDSLSFWKKAAERPLHSAPSDKEDATGVPWLRDVVPDA